MVDIVRNAVAGTLESGDLLVKVSPSEDGTMTLHIESEVIKQFGKQIRATIVEILETLSVRAATIVVSDKGALDCVVRARVESALLRGAGVQDLNWKVL
jgi:citrate lyase subunit gamma (acyl carrier protein)